MVYNGTISILEALEARSIETLCLANFTAGPYPIPGHLSANAQADAVFDYLAQTPTTRLQTVYFANKDDESTGYFFRQLRLRRHDVLRAKNSPNAPDNA